MSRAKRATKTRFATYFGKTPKPHDESLRGEEHPLYTFHLSFTLLVELDFLNNEIILSSIEETRVSSTCLGSSDFFEGDSLSFDGNGGEIVKELSWADE